MRTLTDDEAKLLERAEKRRRAAAHYQHRLSALDATQDLLTALIEGLPAHPTTPKRVHFKIALRRRQAVVESSWPGLPQLIAYLRKTHAQALTDLGVDGWR